MRGKNQLRTFVIGSVACLATATTMNAAYAAEPGGSRDEHIGVGVGLVIGAFAGGPVGAIAGAAVGAKLGESIDDKRQAVKTLSAEVESSRTDLERLEKQARGMRKRNDELDRELRDMQAMARPELMSLLQAGIEMDLLFRTAEHVLSDDTGARVGELAATLASMSDVHVKLDGYSDERGDETYNDELSRLRAEHVRDLLLESGVAAERIQMRAHGEDPAAEPGIDSYALKRKVSLTLFVPDSPALVSSRD